MQRPRLRRTDLANLKLPRALITMKFSVCTLLLSALVLHLLGCASHTEDIKLQAKTLYISADSSPTKVIVDQIQHVERVFTPEGLRNSVKSTDFKYFIVTPNGSRTDLPFLNQECADKSELIDHLQYDSASGYWIGVTLLQTEHMEHIKGGGLMAWRYAPDEYIKLRVKVFSKSTLVRVQDIQACNPIYEINPPVRYSKTAALLHYCSEVGASTYSPIDGVQKTIRSAICCPSIDNEIYRPKRFEGTYVVE